MGLDRRAAPAGLGIGLVRAERLPFLPRHGEIERGQHHQPVGQDGHDPKQPRHCRRGGGDAGGADEARRRPFAPARRDRAQQAVAAVGEVDRALGGKQGRPVGEDELELVERFLPMDGESGRSRANVASRADRPPRSAIDRACAPDPRRAGAPRRRRAAVALDQAGGSISRRAGSIAGGTGAAPPRAARACRRSARRARIADRHQPRQQQATAARRKGILIARRGVGNQDDPWPDRAGRARTGAPERRERVGEARCGGMVKTFGITSGD